MFRELRRRHHDVNIVILPPQSLPDVPLPATSLSDAQRLERRTRGALAEILHAAGREPAGTAGLWWRQGPVGSYRFVARATFTGVDTPIPVLREMYDHLDDSGWRVRPLAEPRPRFEGRHGPLRVRADAYPTAIEVEVVSEAVALDRETLAGLEGRG